MKEVVLVGTSDAFGAGGRRQSAYLVRTAGGGVLLDCGSTTDGGLAELEIPRDEIDVILLSHFHADHFGGVPLFLLGACYHDHRRKPLTIAGPPDVEARVRRAASALGHPIEGHDFGFELSFEEIASGQSRPIGPLGVRAFPAHHAPDAHPQGYVVQARGRSVAYSGDTGWFRGFPDHVQGSDLFLCECTFTVREMDTHLCLPELAEHRESFEVGRMLLTHLGPDMRVLDDPCGFELADDGMVVKL